MDTRIRLITKEKFYSIIPIEDKKFRKIPCQENFIEDPNFRYQRYFMIDNYPFVWIKDYNLILIPESFPEELDSFIISEGIFTLQNWKIAKINDQVPYIRNEYTRTSGLAEFEDWYYEEGEYEIIDTISSEKYKVSVLVKTEGGYYSYVSSYICYEEKLNYPPSSIEEKRMDEFYKLIFKTNGEEFKKSYNKSEQKLNLV